MPVYDPEKEKTFEPHKRAPGEHDDLGVHPERREAEVADLERSFAASPDRPAEKEREAVDKATGADDDTSGGFFKDTSDSDGDGGKKGIRGWSTRKKAATGGIAGGIGALLIGGILSISSGPLQFLHFSQLLQQFHFSNSDNFTNGRASQLIRYAQTRSNPQGAASRNLGYFGDKIAVRYQNRLASDGIIFDYNNRGRLDIIRIDPNTDAGERALRNLENDGFDVNRADLDADGRVTVVLTGTKAKLRRGAIGATVDAVNLNNVSNSVAARLLRIRADVNLSPIKNLVSAADERFFAKLEELRERRKTYIQEGSSGISDVSANDGSDGDSDTSPTQSEIDEANTTATEGNTTLDQATAPNESPSVRAGNIRSALGAGVGVAGAAALVCGLQSLGENAAAVQSSNVVKPLIRNGFEVISIGSQIQAGHNVNLEELGLYTQLLYDEATESSWMQAESIQAELGNPNSGVPMDEAAIPGTDKPAFFEALDSVIGTVDPSGQVCDAVTSTGGQIIITALDIGTAATGPFKLLATVAFEVGTQAATNAFADDIVQWIAGDVIDTDVTGAMYGNYANYGAFLGNNDRMASMGGRQLSGGESAQLDQLRDEELKQDMKHKSLYARFFDLKEPNSLAAQTILGNPSFASSGQAVNSVSQAPVRTVGSIFSNISSIFTPQSQAQSGVYDYGVPEIGYSVADLDSDIADSDPYENARLVEGDLDNLNEKYGDCFTTEINDETGEIKTSDVVSYIDPPAQCSDTNDSFLRYRLYLADMTVAQSLTCFGGVDEASCENLGFENEADSASGGQLPEGVVGIEDIEDIPPWLGLGRGCHKNIAARTRQMLEAASAAGIELRGNCWRSSEEQMRLREQNCPDPINSPAGDCSPPTAKPGESNHEKGLAIDFSNCSRGSPCFTWLSANAGTYGFYNLPSESWHWSVDGS